MNEKESTPSCPTKDSLQFQKQAAKIEAYKFGEDRYLKEIENYINSTYYQHYAQSKYQATDTILDAGYGEGFCMGNILKYWKRYGKKDGKNRKDLLKIIHYAIMQLHIHDEALKGSYTYEPKGIAVAQPAAHPFIGPFGRTVKDIADEQNEKIKKEYEEYLAKTVKAFDPKATYI